MVLRFSNELESEFQIRSFLIEKENAGILWHSKLEIEHNVVRKTIPRISDQPLGILMSDKKGSQSVEELVWQTRFGTVQQLNRAGYEVVDIKSVCT